VQSTISNTAAIHYLHTLMSKGHVLKYCLSIGSIPCLKKANHQFNAVTSSNRKPITVILLLLKADQNFQ